MLVSEMVRCLYIENSESILEGWPLPSPHRVKNLKKQEGEDFGLSPPLPSPLLSSSVLLFFPFFIYHLFIYISYQSDIVIISINNL